VFETIGGAHQDYARKFGVTGVEAKKVSIKERLWKYDDLPAILGSIGATGIVLGEEMSVVLSAHRSKNRGVDTQTVR
jgi:hypothetical protein